MPKCFWKVLPLLWVLAALSQQGRAHAQSSEAVFAMANEEFAAENHDRAIAHYSLLLQSGLRDPDIFYNLGCAYGEAKQYGRAIAAFETALSLRPRDSAATAALLQARTLLAKKQAQAHGEASMQLRPPILEAITRIFRESELAIALLILNTLGFALLLARRQLERESARLAAAWAAVLVFGLTAFDATLLLKKRGTFEDGARAIVVVDTTLRAAPDARAARRANAAEGVNAHILQATGTFALIELDNGARGWTERTTIASTD